MRPTSSKRCHWSSATRRRLQHSRCALRCSAPVCSSVGSSGTAPSTLSQGVRCCSHYQCSPTRRCRPSGVGDIVCQLIARARADKSKGRPAEPFSLVRSIRMTVHGMVVRASVGLSESCCPRCTGAALWSTPASLSLSCQPLAASCCSSLSLPGSAQHDVAAYMRAGEHYTLPHLHVAA